MTKIRGAVAVGGPKQSSQAQRKRETERERERESLAEPLHHSPGERKGLAEQFHIMVRASHTNKREAKRTANKRARLHTGARPFPPREIRERKRGTKNKARTGAQRKEKAKRGCIRQAWHKARSSLMKGALSSESLM